MDLDAIIARKPQIVLVDELAHTNAPGSRHAKRYQDVQEILENGINVYTTVNVQHLESRSDTVAQITGIIVRETLPDEIFENADEVELVDLTPEELLQRLSEGKVYTPERSREAIENFFRKGNITALREMALRIVADRVDKQLHDYMQLKRISGPWKSGLHLLVALITVSNLPGCCGGQKTFPTPWVPTFRPFMLKHSINLPIKNVNNLIRTSTWPNNWELNSGLLQILIW